MIVDEAEPSSQPDERRIDRHESARSGEQEQPERAGAPEVREVARRRPRFRRGAAILAAK
jgi:hypothetical protein